jgi:hypothetical protein
LEDAGLLALDGGKYISGREAERERLEDYEFCRDLVSEFARESARRTGEAMGDIRDRYEMIVAEFLAARYVQSDGKHYSLGSALLSYYETHGKLKEFLKELGTWIELYVLRCISREPIYHWNLNGSEAARAVETLRRHAVSEGLMTALGVEYVKDRRTLMRFLEAVFKRWREIDQPNSLWRVRLIAQQHLGKPKVVAQYVENTGVVSKCTNKRHFESLRAKIKQYCSRGSEKRFGKTPKGAVTESAWRSLKLSPRPCCMSRQ